MNRQTSRDEVLDSGHCGEGQPRGQWGKCSETYSVTYSPRHRWYFHPHVRTDEALMLKCYDSRSDVARKHRTARVSVF